MMRQLDWCQRLTSVLSKPNLFVEAFLVSREMFVILNLSFLVFGKLYVRSLCNVI